MVTLTAERLQVILIKEPILTTDRERDDMVGYFCRCDLTHALAFLTQRMRLPECP